MLDRKGHLSEFVLDLDNAITEERNRMKREAAERLDQNLRGKLETDPDFRKLVAHALVAATVKQTKSLEYELSHSLFGYTNNLDDFRQVNGEYRRLMEQYGLQTFDARKLVQLGKEFLQNEGSLPVVSAPYDRKEGRMYYMDRVDNGSVVNYVKSVGLKYVYIDGGGRWLKKDTRHHQHVVSRQYPQSKEDYLFNVLVRFHNVGLILNAHLGSVEEFVRRLLSIHNFYSYRGMLKRRATQIIQQAESEVIEDIINEINRQLGKTGLVEYRKEA